MDGEKFSRIGSFETEGGSGSHDIGEDLIPDTIDLTGLFANDVTSSGSFDFGGLSATWLGKLLDALPIPALLLDHSGYITFANYCFGKIGPAYGQMQGSPFSELFLEAFSAKEALSVLEGVFSTRKGGFSEAVIKIDNVGIWGRMHFRSVRMGQDRWVFLLIEDLSPEKKQPSMNQLQQEEVLKARNELEGHVARTHSCPESPQCTTSQRNCRA